MPTAVSLNIQLTKEDCKRPAKCINRKEGHPAYSRQCQARHTDKEILKLKYTRNIPFPEARKIVDSYTAPPGKVMQALQRLLALQCHVLMLQHKQTLYISQERQSSPYNSASTEAERKSKSGKN